MEIPIKDIPVYEFRQKDGIDHDKTTASIPCLPSETLLDAPPDSVILQSNHVSSEPPLDSNSYSSEIAGSEQSDGEELSVDI